VIKYGKESKFISIQEKQVDDQIYGGRENRDKANWKFFLALEIWGRKGLKEEGLGQVNHLKTLINSLILIL